MDEIKSHTRAHVFTHKESTTKECCVCVFVSVCVCVCVCVFVCVFVCVLSNAVKSCKRKQCQSELFSFFFSEVWGGGLQGHPGQTVLH